MPQLILVPTSHIAAESMKAVRQAIDSERPGCVGVELDHARFMALSSRRVSNMEALRQLGPATFLIYYVFSNLQQSLGKRVGVFPGSEMLFAVRYAQEKGISVAFIDRNIAHTLEGIKGLPLREKIKLLLYAVFGGLLSRSGRKIDLHKVPEDKLVSEAMQEIRKEFPGLYKVLITDRDAYMSRALKRLMARHGKVVAVVGAGHVAGIERNLKAAA